MSVKVKIPTQLRGLVDGRNELQIDGVSTVADLLDKLGSDHPSLVERIREESGEIRRFINIYVGDEDVRFLEGTSTPIPDSEVVSILPAVAGGS